MSKKNNRKQKKHTAVAHKTLKRFQNPKARSVPAPIPNGDFRKLMQELERRPYFELTPSEKTAVARLEKTFNSPVEAWSFILHPDVMQVVQGETQKLIRYIFTVDTLMAKAYFDVQEFLRSQKVNINSYFSGGWADFVCEAHLTEKQFNQFLNSVKEILTRAGATKLVENENVNELISVFQVKAALILCGKQIAKVARPDREILDEIKSDLVKFEVVYRNYRSEDAKNYFSNGEKGLRAYVKRLEAGHAILCYKAVFDRSRHLEWDYVPLQRARRSLHLTEAKMQQPKVLKPIVDLLEVDPIGAVDKEEAEVSHIFINEYDFPGERQDWKRLIYQSTGDNANLYTYPLEGTLNEAPIYLTDVPEILERAASYKTGEISLGQVDHPLIKTPMAVNLALSSLSNHGVTLGMPGTGKTNTDMRLFEQIAAHVATVLILDASQSVKGKLPVLHPELAKKLRQIPASKLSTPEEMSEAASCITQPGFYLLEPEGGKLPNVLDAVMKRLEEVPDATVGNQARLVRGFLLIEEANDAFGNNEQEREERLRLFEGLLNKASRKGWAIWLSTQYPSHLGKDDDARLRLLNALKNRIVHAINGEDDIGLLLRMLEADGANSEDREFVKKRLQLMKTTGEKGMAVIFGTEKGDQGVALRPISVKIGKLSSSSQ